VAGDAVRVGVLALQGAFREHRQALERLGVETSEVRRAADLVGLDGLVIPGGESTTIRMLMTEYGVLDSLRSMVAEEFPVMGTCAGMIVLADRVDGVRADGVDALDISVRRNAFGRQVDSFEADIPISKLGDESFHAVFIRAPIVEEVDEGVDVLARLDDGRVVAVRQGFVVGTAFHPEMTSDSRFHQYFLDLVAERKKTGGSGQRERQNAAVSNGQMIRSTQDARY
jgi:pyridoxal 5'-phosphate synthase pdxT subunit